MTVIQAGVRDRRHLHAALVLLAVAQLIAAADYNIVFVALPQIGQDLHFAGQDQQLVINAYDVIWGGFLLVGGRAADLAGKRRMFVLGLILFGASSLAGGLSVSPWMLVAARSVQGLGAAVLYPAMLALIATTYREGRERSRAMAIWAAAGASGLSVGSLLSGVLTSIFSWHAVFFINVPVAAAVAAAAFLFIPADERATQAPRRLDLPGALTGTAGASLLVLALVEAPVTGWTAVPVLTAGAAAAALLIVFTVIQARRVDPLLPLRLLAHRTLATAATVMFVFQGCFSAVLYFTTLYFQQVHSYTALRAGLAFLPLTVFTLAGTRIAGRMLARFGLRASLVGGQIVLTAGLVLLASGMSATGSYPALLPGILVTGIGNGLTWTAMFTAAAAGISDHEQGIASGVASTFRQTGAATGLAALVAIAAGAAGAGHTAAHEAQRASLVHGYHAAIYAAAAAILAAALLSATTLRTRPSSTPNPGHRQDSSETQ